MATEAEAKIEDRNPDRKLWDRAFQICAEKGWDSDNILNWVAAIGLARKGAAS